MNADYPLVLSIGRINKGGGEERGVMGQQSFAGFKEERGKMDNEKLESGPIPGNSDIHRAPSIYLTKGRGKKKRDGTGCRTIHGKERKAETT